MNVTSGGHCMALLSIMAAPGEGEYEKSVKTALQTVVRTSRSAQSGRPKGLHYF